MTKGIIQPMPRGMACAVGRVISIVGWILPPWVWLGARRNVPGASYLILLQKVGGSAFSHEKERSVELGVTFIQGWG